MQSRSHEGINTGKIMKRKDLEYLEEFTIDTADSFGQFTEAFEAEARGTRTYTQNFV